MLLARQHVLIQSGLQSHAMQYVQALHRKEIAKFLKLAVPHIGVCPSHDDFGDVALKVMRRQRLEDLEPETLSNHLMVITLVSASPC